MKHQAKRPPARYCNNAPKWLGPIAAALLLAGGVPARADEHLVLVDRIDVGGNGLGAFDISYTDPAINLYVLADRTNASVDFVNASDDTFIGRVGGFQGVALNPNGTANNALSGPDGVAIIGHKEVWAGDGDSTIKVISIAQFAVTDTISIIDPTNPDVKMRVDEMAWDAADHIMAAANNANSPPFITMVNTDTHQVLGQIVFNGENGTPDATETGIEASQWSPKTGLFYVAVPQISPDNPAEGGVAVIDPIAMKVVAVYPVTNCAPSGLALGPRNEALIGCSGIFGTAPDVISQSLVINVNTGDVTATIPAGGNDEVWYDKGTKHYYMAARSNQTPSGAANPILGVVDAISNMFDGGVATSTTAHSVAADSRSRRVFVPIGFVPPGSPSGTDPTNPCPTNGCIAVYAPSRTDDDGGGWQAPQ